VAKEEKGRKNPGKINSCILPIKKSKENPDQDDEENSTSHQTIPVKYVTLAVPVVLTIVMRTIESAGMAEVVEE